jgi:hypothetical protein
MRRFGIALVLASALVLDIAGGHVGAPDHDDYD